MMKTLGYLLFALTIAVAVLTLAACSPSETPVVAEDHFHPKGKPPSKYTIEIIEKARATMPFSDKRDFEEQKKGFIAAPESMILPLIGEFCAGQR